MWVLCEENERIQGSARGQNLGTSESNKDFSVWKWLGKNFRNFCIGNNKMYSDSILHKMFYLRWKYRRESKSNTYRKQKKNIHNRQRLSQGEIDGGGMFSGKDQCGICQSFSIHSHCEFFQGFSLQVLKNYILNQWFPTFFISRPHSKIWHKLATPFKNMT